MRELKINGVPVRVDRLPQNMNDFVNRYAQSAREILKPKWTSIRFMPHCLEELGPVWMRVVE